MTILYTARVAGENSALAHRCTWLPESRLKRLLDRHLFRKLWLRVSHESRPDDWARIYETALRGGLGVLQLMIHSSELMTGTSPLTRTEKETAFVYESLATMFRTFRQRGLQGEFLSRYRRSVCQRDRRVPGRRIMRILFSGYHNPHYETVTEYMERGIRPWAMTWWSTMIAVTSSPGESGIVSRLFGGWICFNSTGGWYGSPDGSVPISPSSQAATGSWALQWNP